ncbi:MAG: hypothetical protein V5A88_02205 [Candidatus Thermoplasmatota archaeon]
MSLDISDRTAGILAITGGILLSLGGWIGVINLLSIFREIVVEEMGIGNSSLVLIFKVLIFFAGLGGISIIIGGILVLRDQFDIGRILILLGVGIGVLGLVISLVINWLNGSLTDFYGYLFHTLEGIGLLLSILASKGAKV